MVVWSRTPLAFFCGGPFACSGDEEAALGPLCPLRQGETYFPKGEGPPQRKKKKEDGARVVHFFFFPHFF